MDQFWKAREGRAAVLEKPLVPAKAGGADDGERERMRLLMRAEKVRVLVCATGLHTLLFFPAVYFRLNRGAKQRTSSSLTTAKSSLRRSPC